MTFTDPEPARRPPRILPRLPLDPPPLQRESGGPEGNGPALPVVGSGASAVPERIGGYRISRVLGRGSRGVVYLAYRDGTSRAVAVKVLRTDAHRLVRARRFEREGQTLARLDHPGIARILQAGVVDLGLGAEPYLVTELVDGRPLTQYAREEQLSRRERVTLLLRAARAVQHAHGMAVLHANLKPENVLVLADGTPRVLDFDVPEARDERSARLASTAAGQAPATLAYAAPEVARGARVDARTDQFALGALLHELLTGEVPFDVRGRLPHQALRIVADGLWSPPASVEPPLDEDLLAILATALAAAPSARYADVRALADDLERWLAGGSVLARPISALRSLARLTRCHAALSAAVACGLVSLGACLGLGLALLLRSGS